MAVATPTLTPPLAAATTKYPVGIAGNVAQQRQGRRSQSTKFELIIVEFDDQGRCYERAQMDALEAKLDSLAGTDAVIVTFVHRWKHNAKADDDNLCNFLIVLEQTVAREASVSVDSGTPPRPVLGVCVAWRGMSLYGLWLEKLTFWDRQDAGRRVAVGSVRELLGRIRQYRNVRLSVPKGKPLLVVVGHSFGGMIVFSALAQSLIESALSASNQIVPGFADLVLLVNPAFEAGRHMPLYDLAQVRRGVGLPVEQPPVFVCATAKNDLATAIAFPIGNLPTLVTQSFRGWRERGTAIRMPGHVPWMTTHTITADGAAGYTTEPQNGYDDNNPFWIVQAHPSVINGHNGIFGSAFLNFVGALVFAHLRKTHDLDFSIPNGGGS
jgi:hypothetical protein